MNINKKIVLCVDDEKPILSSLSRLLRRHNYEVLVAESVTEALDILQNRTIDVLISDMRMPQINGVVLLTEAAQRWPDTIRILLTGYSEFSDSKKVNEESNIYSRIDKPWDDHDLISTIESGLTH